MANFEPDAIVYGLIIEGLKKSVFVSIQIPEA
jgi:hypothetical protein